MAKSEHDDVQYLYFDIHDCARCGANHTRLAFRHFDGEPIESDSTVFNWWAICPLKHDPIFLHIDSPVKPEFDRYDYNPELERLHNTIVFDKDRFSQLRSEPSHLVGILPDQYEGFPFSHLIISPNINKC